ncbi:hypothetical protein [uncultured Jannaschia sp.]|uniref:hypothetical protein n=1 Tax=uncultured Jannaschia sp. TaxID=293347 RepID=UPI002636879E|nr:hypothetical protein [uncultured Jannaschia sp.]
MSDLAAQFRAMPQHDWLTIALIALTTLVLLAPAALPAIKGDRSRGAVTCTVPPHVTAPIRCGFSAG